MVKSVKLKEDADILKTVIWKPINFITYPKIRSSSPSRFKNFLHVVQTGPGAHPVSYSMGTGGCFPEGKAAGE
jgi:hypothetical protein